MLKTEELTSAKKRAKQFKEDEQLKAQWDSLQHKVLAGQWASHAKMKQAQQKLAAAEDKKTALLTSVENVPYTRHQSQYLS